MGNSVQIKNYNGETLTVELISYFELVDTKKKYIFYTLNEIVENGLVKMYVAEVSNDTNTILEKMTNEEWSNLKGIMKSMLTGNVNPNINYLKWEA